MLVVNPACMAPGLGCNLSSTHISRLNAELERFSLSVKVTTSESSNVVRAGWPVARSASGLCRPPGHGRGKLESADRSHRKPATLTNEATGRYSMTRRINHGS